MKKFIAFVCALAMMISVMAATTLVASAAVTEPTVVLEFAGYEVVGGGVTTFAKIDVIVEIPDNFVPYAALEPDWVNTFDYSYEGLMLQGFAVDIPYIEGLQFIKAKSSVTNAAFAAAGLAVNDNTKESKAQLAYLATGAPETYYTGELGKVATLYYRVTGDVNGSYDVAASDIVIGLVDVNEDGALISREYKFADVAITNATVAPAQPEPEEEKVVMTAAPFITDVATSEEKDGWQAGQAVALQFATADLAEFVAMNWKLTVAGVNRFAKVDDAAFATIKATAAETVDVFASFIVNTAENVEATPITAVSAGFLKADDTVVEAE